MANASLILSSALTGLLAVLTIAPAHGCGGWDEEPAPLLPYYLGQLPAKSFGQIYGETRPQKKTAPTLDLHSLVNRIITSLATEKRSTLLAWIDEALPAARQQYETGEDCNFLHDCRDAVASAGSIAEVADYLRWRHENTRSFFVEKPQPNRQEEPSPRPPLDPALKAGLEQKIKEATPAMLPQWIYARAALDFLQGDRVKCQPAFQQIWTDFPAHPRAEIALYMSARCLRAQSQVDMRLDFESSGQMTAQQQVDREETRKRALTDAVSQFERYLVQYPQGRFAADAHGWLGGLKLLQQDRLAAFQHFAAQLESPDHPEVAKSALFMCEDLLGDSRADEDALFAEAARHPIAAMGMTYLVLNMADARGARDDADQSHDWNPARDYALATSRSKRWRQVVLPKLAAQVVAQKERYTAGDWPPRYLAMLAQAASAAGRQEEALALTSMPNRGAEGSDDLLLARAIAQQRAGKAGEAIATYRTLLAQFPKSPLVRGVRLKLALALQDDHQAGAAWFALRQLLAEVKAGREGYSEDVYPPPYAALTLANSFAKEDISAAEVDQIEQLIETLANFAPLPELAAVLPESSMDEPARLDLRALIAQRALAMEDFARAKEVMSPAQFTLSTGPLEPLMTQLAAAKTPAAKARAMDSIGDAWAKLRGQMLARPLQINSDPQAALRLRVNGQALGCASVNEALEERDELRHASRWWMRAARAQPGTPLAAAARWKALDAMPQIASGSQFAFTRAIEADAAETSRELYDRLRKECPKSREAREYATYWSFPQPAHHPLAEGEFASFQRKDDRDRDAIGKMGWAAFDYGAFGVVRDFTEEDEQSGDAAWRALEKRIQALPAKAIQEQTAPLLAEVESLAKTARELRSSAPNARTFNLLDDLISFLKSPQLSHPAQIAYVELRLRFNKFLTNDGEDNEGERLAEESRINELLADPALQPHRDYADFIKAVREGKGLVSIVAKDVTKEGEPLQLSSVDYPKLQNAMAAYLKTHPQGAKREAALFIQLRAAHWLSTPLLTTLSIRLPTALPQTEDPADFATELKTYWRTPFDPKPLQKLLAQYEREFPQSHYAADVANYRADLLCRLQEWSPALDLTLATLSDATHPELQAEAALRLANLFAELAHASSRTDLLGAIRTRPQAILRLQQYLGKTWRQADHPLRYLGQYLADQLGFAYTSPHHRSKTPRRS